MRKESRVYKETMMLMMAKSAAYEPWAVPT
jgi:hypothetical protein